MSPGAIPVAFTQTNVPVVFWADATFASLVGYHPEYKRLSRETLKDGYATEGAALERAAAAIFASEWAAQSAVELMGMIPPACTSSRTVPTWKGRPAWMRSVPPLKQDLEAYVAFCSWPWIGL